VTPAPPQTAPSAYPAPPYPFLAPGFPSYGVLPLELEGNRGDLRMVLSQAEGERPFVRCVGRCVLALEPGRYTLTVGATRQTPEGSREFELERPSRLRIAPSERSAHPLETTGFVLLLAGGAAFGLGMAFDEDSSSDNLLTSSEGLLLGGALSVVSGVILFVIGASIGPSAKPDVQMEPL
jgi:hypothetical protein